MGLSNSISVLVADDDKVTRELLMSILKNEGYHLLGEAWNGTEAVKRYVELRPDIVLLDTMMPKMDGLNPLVEIRKVNPAAVVLLVSASFTAEMIKDALQKGAAGFVVKPFRPADVLSKISTGWKARKK